MRIISGKYKGRKLISSNDLDIRPTTDRVKEYIFDILYDYPKDKMVADIFSGSGSLGIEALSRGAEKAVFVDNSNKSMNILRENIQTLRIPDEKYEIYINDAAKFAENNQTVYDLYLIDPPFKYDALQNLIDGLFTNRVMHENSIVVLEHEISNMINKISGLYEIIKQKKFGRSIISFIVKKA